MHFTYQGFIFLVGRQDVGSEDQQSFREYGGKRN